ncbi:MAG: hypothetical protein R3244_07240 [Thermoanaerobaculia bacterium]|nr:hypothetical protein [Thermoanaerobaculia bacterium]
MIGTTVSHYKILAEPSRCGAVSRASRQVSRGISHSSVGESP